MPTLRDVLIASLLSSSAAASAAPVASPPVVEPQSVLDGDRLRLDAIARDTRRLLDEAGIDAVLTSRVKAPASVAEKMRRKGLRADEVHDRLGLRLIVADVDTAYRVRDLVEARHAPIPGGRRDYVRHPKPNGYRALHTAVRTPQGVAEFQVRTHEMHAWAEHGPAAHWRYKLAQAG